jgi:hypothetical protein
MRGDEDKLHAANEIGASHHHKRRVAECDLHRDAGRGIADFVGGRLRQRNLVDLAGKPGGRQQRQRQHHEAGKARSPAVILIQHLPQWRRQQGTERSRRRNDPEHRAPYRRRHRARRHRHRDGSGRARQRRSDQDARSQHDAENSLRARHQHQPRDIKQRAHHHDAAKAVSHRERAGERLQKAPGEVLYRNREGEIRYRDPDVTGQRLQEDAERLAQAHAEAEHQRGADQNRQRGTKHTQQGHAVVLSFGRDGERRLAVAS